MLRIRRLRFGMLRLVQIPDPRQTFWQKKLNDGWWQFQLHAFFPTVTMMRPYSCRRASQIGTALEPEAAAAFRTHKQGSPDLGGFHKLSFTSVCYRATCTRPGPSPAAPWERRNRSSADLAGFGRLATEEGRDVR